MQIYKDEWLPNLKDSVPVEAFGYTVSMYSIALEGWRRGLNLKFINKNRRKSEIEYSLEFNGKERKFSVTRGDLVPKEAIKVCINKDLTKKLLIESNVPTPEGEVFEKEVEDNEIIEFAKKLGFPVVIKPSNGTGGAGVIANIKDEIEFRDSLIYVRHELNFPKVIVEKFYNGEDYRLYVIGNEVTGAFKKIPANVIGDGENTIKTLIKIKNEQRNNTPALHKRTIKIDKELHNMLKSQNYTLESTPTIGEQVFLKSKNNVSAGGDSVDITEELTDEIKKIAIKASNAIPGLVQCGVDMIVDNANNSGVILEVNSRPHITAHLFPWHGQARDIPKSIIDYYFPETKDMSLEQQNLFYFDFKHIFDTFQSGIAKEITIPKVPSGVILSKIFHLIGDLNKVSYCKWIRKTCRDLHLNGSVQYTQHGVDIVASGSFESISKISEILKGDSPQNTLVKSVEECDWTKPVKIGFEINEEYKSGENVDSNTETKIKYLRDGYFPLKISEKTNKSKGNSKSKTIKKERKNLNEDYYKKKYNMVIKSTSWRITKPLRFFGRLIKKIKNN
ncbi:ATP-grasp domain-containing protein [Evansella tamaricis]|uniref:ATP-grasp domain-containing protein n=1 Tax=Evansella tamaricis TaxID=2069301 RepID=A0ABS6JH12_9BACI|nr:ATP-grasp domain-containing protein [Evansella tamaricis]MBU9712954.1 ATP-grasp domain-containing protein [Evansella tamaricis]